MQIYFKMVGKMVELCNISNLMYASIFILHIVNMATAISFQELRDCTQIAFVTHYGKHRAKGSLVKEEVSFNECALYCEEVPYCVAFDWQFFPRRCWFHYDSSPPVDNSCCLHGEKVCRDDVNNTATTVAPTRSVMFSTGSDTTATSSSTTSDSTTEHLSTAKDDVTSSKPVGSTEVSTVETSTAQSTGASIQSTVHITTESETTSVPRNETTTSVEILSTDSSQETTEEATTSPTYPSTTLPTKSTTLPLRSTTLPYRPRSTTPPRRSTTLPQLPSTPSIRQISKRPSTTPPSLLTTTTIPDLGRCPDKFHKLDNSSLSSGDPLTGKHTAETCKAACLADPTCKACTHDRDNQTCAIHTVLNVTDLASGTDPCCAVYKKTECSTHLNCYSHETVEQAKQKNLNAEVIRLGKDQRLSGLNVRMCKNFCYVGETITFASGGTSLKKWTLERGCDPSLDDSFKVPGCTTHVIEGDDGTRTISLQCRCYTERCNALNFRALEHLVAYYPLDFDSMDYSSRGHHGLSTDVIYEGFDTVTNAAAMFDKGSFISVKSLASFPYGLLHPQTYKRRGRLTIALWFKSPSATDHMVLLSNGPRKGPVEVSVVGDKLTAALTLQDFKNYEVSASAPSGEWNFLAVRLAHVGGSRAKREAFLEIFINADIDTQKPSGRLQVSIEPVLPSVHPMVLGRRFVPPGSAISPDHYSGLLDEVYLFNDALTMGQLQAIRDLTKKF